MAFQASARFDSIEVDFRAGELRKHGVRVRLQMQPFTILSMLLERPGEVVTREELRRAVWPEETFVEFDRGLNNAMNRLRDALGDSAAQRRFIETLPRRGYRFIAPVEKVQTRGPRPTEIREADQMALSEALPPDRIIPTTTGNRTDAVTKQDSTQLQIQNAEYYESIGDVWRAAELYEALASDSIVDRNSDSALEIERRAKKCRTVAAAAMRDGLSGTEQPEGSRLGITTGERPDSTQPMDARGVRGRMDSAEPGNPIGARFSEYEIHLSDTWEKFIAYVKDAASDVRIESVSEDPDCENSFYHSGKPGHLNYPIIVQGTKRGASFTQHFDLVRDWLHPLALELAGANSGIPWDTALFPVKGSFEKEVLLNEANTKCRDCIYWVLFANMTPVANHTNHVPAGVIGREDIGFAENGAYLLATAMTLEAVLVVGLCEGASVKSDVVRAAYEGIPHLINLGTNASVPGEVLAILRNMLRTKDAAKALDLYSQFTVRTLNYFQSDAPPILGISFFLGVFISLVRRQDNSATKADSAQDFVRSIKKIETRAPQLVLPSELQHGIRQVSKVPTSENVVALADAASVWADSLFDDPSKGALRIGSHLEG